MTFICSYEDGTKIQNCQNLLPVVIGNTCNNLIKSITYIISYDNSAGGVVNAGIKAIFFNQPNYLTDNNVKILQTFSIFFIPSKIKLTDFDLLENQILSGNPGYIFGKPIKAGVSTNSVIKLAYCF